jgi:hypothetical protein
MIKRKLNASFCNSAMPKSWLNKHRSSGVPVLLVDEKAEMPACRAKAAGELGRLCLDVCFMPLHYMGFRKVPCVLQ